VAALVLDCSAALSWFMPDEGGPDAAELRERVISEGAVVPVFWPIEIGNVLLFAMRRRRINASHRAAALEALGQLPIDIDPGTLNEIWTATLALADELRLTLYDACYLELARRRTLPLATLDKELRSASRKLGVPLLG
jgi:predicted nucleic acid-binding protein